MASSNSRDITVSTAFLLSLTTSFYVAHNIYSINLISHPIPTLALISLVQTPITILLFSLLRQNPQQCSYWKAVLRGVLGLPIGAFLMAFGAIVLGAPIGIQYLEKTIYWSLLMSVFTEDAFELRCRLETMLLLNSEDGSPISGLTQCSDQIDEGLILFYPANFTRFGEFVPAASVYGSSWKDWQRLFANTKPTGSLEYIICIPAHGAIIGAWLGAWPMPLDWERPWQEWPICVSYGAVAGYTVGMVVSMGFVLVLGKRQRHVKND
ncbi:hypothetical protein IFM89_016069 [Coptis chinensis]|uniref:Phosphatidylinositol-glycan biosynthesis class F protein n=1 Tax=Coptis chinensis TaxID=261450 RepID=A0A835ICA9_9MAGN|nr:hypothetical protein IFM89_016069 [Coptis chinensis]